MFPYSTRMRSGSRLRRPSPALVIALVALFFSLTGTGLAGKKSASTDPVVGVHETPVTQTINAPRGQSSFTALTCPGKNGYAIAPGYTLDGQVVIWAVFPIGAHRWFFGYTNESTTSAASVSFAIQCLRFLH